MPRKRMIHPDLWADEEVGRLSRDARLLWIAMFSLADDEGRGTASAAYLRRAVFGFDDDVTQEMVAGWRGEIATTMRNIVFYQEADREFYRLVNWRRYQKVETLERRRWLVVRKQLAPIVFGTHECVCPCCGSTSDLTIDHIIPLARGGTHAIGNLQILCRKCNSRKGARWEG